MAERRRSSLTGGLRAFQSEDDILHGSRSGTLSRKKDKKFDKDGFPTHDTNGKELTKNQYKKIRKLMEQERKKEEKKKKKAA